METAHWKRIIIGLIDGSIAMGILNLILVNQSPKIIYNVWEQYNSCLSLLVWVALYRLICIFLFKGTIGMRLFKTRFLTGELNTPSIPEYILAAFFVLTNGIGYYEYQSLEDM